MTRLGFSGINEAPTRVLAGLSDAETTHSTGKTAKPIINAASAKRHHQLPAPTSGISHRSSNALVARIWNQVIEPTTTNNATEIAAPRP